MSPTTYVSSLELQGRAQQNAPQLPRPYVQPIPFHSNQNAASHDNRSLQQHLEPVDSGAAAWKLLGAAFVFEALFWGKVSTHSEVIRTILLLTQQLKDFLFPLEFFRITTPVSLSLETVRTFPLWEQ
jgi:hypothetical protein